MKVYSLRCSTVGKSRNLVLCSVSVRTTKCESATPDRAKAKKLSSFYCSIQYIVQILGAVGTIMIQPYCCHGYIFILLPALIQSRLATSFSFMHPTILTAARRNFFRETFYKNIGIISIRHSKRDRL